MSSVDVVKGFRSDFVKGSQKCFYTGTYFVFTNKMVNEHKRDVIASFSFGMSQCTLEMYLCQKFVNISRYIERTLLNVVLLKLSVSLVYDVISWSEERELWTCNGKF